MNGNTGAFDHAVMILFGIFAVYTLIDLGFLSPRRSKKKHATILARAQALEEGANKMCDANKKLRDLMERKGPLSPQDIELKAILEEHDEGEKLFRENSSLTEKGRGK